TNTVPRNNSKYEGWPHAAASAELQECLAPKHTVLIRIIRERFRNIVAHVMLIAHWHTARTVADDAFRIDWAPLPLGINRHPGHTVSKAMERTIDGLDDLTPGRIRDAPQGRAARIAARNERGTIAAAFQIRGASDRR